MFNEHTLRRNADKSKRLFLLRKLNEHKAILWSSHSSSSTTNVERQQKWEQIRRELIEEGHEGYADRSWSYLRDTTWKNWKTRFLAKYENRPRTGLSEEDTLFLSIINAEAPSINKTEPLDEDENEELTARELSPSSPSTNSEFPSNFYNSAISRSESRKRPHTSWEERIAEQKRRKLQLECRLLELQIIEKERQLNIHPFQGN